MLKAKLIASLLVVIPTIFSCAPFNNNGINGNYVVQSPDKITHQFVIGDEKDYDKEDDKNIYIETSIIKTIIYNRFTTYEDTEPTENNTIRLTTATGTAGINEEGERLTLYAVNRRYVPSFFYGKAKDGFHFYQTKYDRIAGRNDVKKLVIYSNPLLGRPIDTNFIDGGFSNALIRSQNRSQKDLSTVYYCNVVISIVCYVILFLPR